MNNIYYKSIFYMYFAFYILLYFGATRFAGKIIYVSEFIRVLLGRANRRNRIPLIVDMTFEKVMGLRKFSATSHWYYKSTGK